MIEKAILTQKNVSISNMAPLFESIYFLTCHPLFKKSGREETSLGKNPEGMGRNFYDKCKNNIGSGRRIRAMRIKASWKMELMGK